MREKEIHNKSIETRWIELVDSYVKKLIIPFKNEFIRIDTCPSCNSNALKFEFSHQELEYDTCQNCNLLLMNPFPSEELKTNYIINSEALEMWRVEIPKITTRVKMYEERADYIEPYLKEYFKNTGKKITLLEVGAGNGELISILLERYDDIIESIIVIEPQIFDHNSSKIKFIKGIFDDESTQTLVGSVDMVLAFEVLEHILYPNAFFENVNKVLKPNGIFGLSTPNGHSLETLINKTLSRNVGFDHVRLYNPKSVGYLAKNHGFNANDICTPGRLDAEMLINSGVLNDTKNIEPIVAKLDAAWMYDFIKNNAELSTEELQAFQSKIVESNLSGHMKCLFTKK